MDRGHAVTTLLLHEQVVALALLDIHVLISNPQEGRVHVRARGNS